jgi:outer membrane protein OmpA-like peptidoglycan-associated protein
LARRRLLDMLVLGTFRRLAIALLLTAAGGTSVRAEPLLVSLEAQGALALTEPQARWFGPGNLVALALHYPLTPVWQVGLRLRAGLLWNGNTPEEPGLRDPGVGTFELATAMLRIRPLAAASLPRRSDGLFFDLGAGGGLTGQLVRGCFEAGIGYGFRIERFSLAPTLRYLQILQPVTALAGDDARLLMLGVELTLNDNAALQPTAAEHAQDAADRDHDGVPDASDACPNEAEDRDDHADEDGCPDPDNDADGIADRDDACPDAAEDLDGFEDADGCPDPDNDHDGIADAQDQCPDEAEVENGYRDEDGCPDEGLIVLAKDRIVLENRVLFESEQARVRHAAWPVLQAIVKLQKQHPEWSSVRVEGHSDARGSNPVFNQELSERRANHVMQMLIKFGMPAQLLHAQGFGSSRLRDRRNEEEAHQRNRRVEFVIEARAQNRPTPESPAPLQPSAAVVPPWAEVLAAPPVAAELPEAVEAK